MSSAGRSEPPSAPPPVAGPEARGLARVATYGIPVFSVLVAALVFLGPGAPRAVLGARVLGQPIEGSRYVALRVETIRSYFDIVETAAVPELIVEAAAAGQELPVVHGASGPDGVAEVRLEAGAPIQGPIALRIKAADGDRRPKVLAEGVLQTARPTPLHAQAAAIHGAAGGDLAIRVDASRGQLAAPFPEVLRVSVTSDDEPSGLPADLELSGAGMEITPQARATDRWGRASFQVKALGHYVDLAVTARAGARTGRWEGTLPVVPGAIWLDPSSAEGTLSLVSPAPRERAYASLWTDEGRVWGAIVPLARDDFGFFRGAVSLAAPGGTKLAQLTVAGDPREGGSGTVAWPLRPSEGAVAPPAMSSLLDGVPAAVARDDRRAWTARSIGLAVIGAAALAEVVLLLLLSRASQRALDAHITAASSADGESLALPEADRAKLMEAAREHPLLRALLAAALLVLAFAMVAALATFR
jgi:hypothetical protein